MDLQYDGIWRPRRYADKRGLDTRKVSSVRGGSLPALKPELEKKPWLLEE